MAKLKAVVKLTEKDLKEIICSVYDLDVTKASISVNHLPGNQREPEFTEVIVESEISIIK